MFHVLTEGGEARNSLKSKYCAKHAESLIDAPVIAVIFSTDIFYISAAYALNHILKLFVILFMMAAFSEVPRVGTCLDKI